MSSPYPPPTQNPYAAPPKPTYAPYSYYAGPPEKSWVWLALVGGHLGTAAYLLFAVLMLVIVGFAVADIPNDDGAAAGAVMFGIFAAGCLGLALVGEVITIGMHLRHKWAWFAGLAMFALYLPSLFFPMGAMGMCGLLMGGSRREFGMG